MVKNDQQPTYIMYKVAIRASVQGTRQPLLCHRLSWVMTLLGHCRYTTSRDINLPVQNDCHGQGHNEVMIGAMKLSNEMTTNRE